MDGAVPGITVIIPTRHEPGLATVVRALLLDADASSTDVEIVIAGVDDWSRLPDDRRVQRIDTGQPLWAPAARNLGLRAASGEVAVFLDGDCHPRPGFLRAILDCVGTEGTIGCGAIETPRDDFWQDAYNLACFREYLSDLPRSTRSTLPSYCLFGPRRAFLDAGGFDPRWSRAEDLDLTARLRRAGHRLVFEPAVRVVHRPPGRSFWRIARVGWLAGGTSIRARLQYPEAFGTRRLAVTPLSLLLGAPLVAFALLVRTWQQHPAYRDIIYPAAPAILAYRLAWCWAAAWSRLRPGWVFEAVGNR